MMHSSLDITQTATTKKDKEYLNFTMPTEKLEKHCEHYDRHRHNLGKVVKSVVPRDRIKLKLDKRESTYKDGYLKKLQSRDKRINQLNTSFVARQPEPATIPWKTPMLITKHR
jgi:hypothetical protein